MGLYLVQFNLRSACQKKKRCHIARMTRDVLTWGKMSGAYYHLTLSADDTLQLDVTPEMGEHIEFVSWIQWDDRGRHFERIDG